jgi:predicted regulator of Ras-like GTPase activity (Roadblock/LC7/MglB family)
MRSSPYTAMLSSLTRLRGVLASLVVSERDGIVIDSHLQVGQEGDRVAALAASLYRKSRLSAKAAGLGRAAFMQLDADRGRICAAAQPARGSDLLLVVVAAPAANVGLIRVEMLKAVEALA